MLNDTLEELRAVALAAEDGAGYFPALYARVTRRVVDDAAAGRFADGPRMEAFVAAFADRYLAARGAAGTGGPDAPACWRAAFGAAVDGRLLVVQHLLLGINAHVNLDLALTVVAVADRSGDLPGIRPDFDAVNEVLRLTYDDVIRDLDRVTRWTGRAATSGGGHLFNFSLRAARDQAWRAAVRLHGLDAAGRAAEGDALDRLVCVLAHLIGRPTVPFRWVTPLARRLETRHPPAVTRALLGPLA